MTKVDVAIQSFKKPESLLYCLMKLKAVSGQWVDTVYINDDSEDSLEHLKSIYLSKKVTDYFYPWIIKVRKNRKRNGWWGHYVIGYFPKKINIIKYIHFLLSNIKHHGNIVCSRNDIRYQWAFDTTDKKYVFLMHDDIFFAKDIIGLYLESFKANEKMAAVGDLGQCHRCIYNKTCNPSKIISNFFPSSEWPKTPSYDEKFCSLACRINEWSALINIKAEKDILKKSKVFFGNYYPDSDIGALWFTKIPEYGFQFYDPLPTFEQRKEYYEHGWNGRSGHSVWVDQGDGKSNYSSSYVLDCMEKEFGCKLL